MAPKKIEPTTETVVKAEQMPVAFLVNATRSDVGFTFAHPDNVADMVAEGLAEVNTEVRNPENNEQVAVRATQKAFTMTDAPAGGSLAPDTSHNPGDTATNVAANVPAAGTASKPVIVRPTGGIVMPEFQRASPGTDSTYPFDDLKSPEEMGKNGDGKQMVDGFFIALTASKPEPWKSLQSTVSAAGRRYGTETGKSQFTKKDGTAGHRTSYEYSRKFRLSEGEYEGQKGAWVTRTA